MFSGRWRWGTVLLGIAIMLMVVIFGRQKNSTNSNTNSDTSSRATYAAEYDGLWRQDNGQSSVLVTATMFPPFLRSALDQAAEKTSEEDQIWSTMEHMPSTNIPIVMTMDSVGGSVPDKTISDSLELQADNGAKIHFDHWTALTGTSHIVNAASGASSQIGVAVFVADRAIDWNHPPQFRLLVKNIAGVSQREFVWTSAALDRSS